MNPRGRCSEGTKSRWVYCLITPVIGQLRLILKEYDDDNNNWKISELLSSLSI
jgi:hypothetical protein